MHYNRRWMSILIVLVMFLQLVPLGILSASAGTVVSSNVLFADQYNKVTFLDLNIVQYVKTGTGLVLPEPPTKLEHKFVGWFDSADQEYGEGSMVTEDGLVAVDALCIVRQG